MWTETIKLLDGNIGENLDDLRFGDDFLDTRQKACSTKEIIDKLDLIKIKIKATALQKTLSKERKDKL